VDIDLIHLRRLFETVIRQSVTCVTAHGQHSWAKCFPGNREMRTIKIAAIAAMLLGSGFDGLAASAILPIEPRPLRSVLNMIRRMFMLRLAISTA
jgi:hypothetical protein